MEKRVDKNKEIYREIDEYIKAKKKSNENSSFDNAQSALSSVNPELFGKNSAKKVKKEQKAKINYGVIIAVVALVALAVVLAVIIL